MILRWTLIGVLILGAHSVFAQDSVRVRSGEHVGFSRIVLYYPQSIPWALNRSDAGYLLQTEGEKFSYQTDDVFKFMPRTRLQDLRPGGSVVDLDVSCDCHANAFEYQPGILVIDIKDGPPPADSEFEARVVEAAPAPEPLRQPKLLLSELHWVDLSTDRPAAPRTPAPVALPNLAGRAVQQAFGATEPATGPRAELSSTADLSDLRTSLTRQLATAVSGGLLVSRGGEDVDKTPELATALATDPTDKSQPEVVRADGLSKGAVPEAHLRLGFLPTGGSPIEPDKTTCHPKDWFSIDGMQAETPRLALAMARGGLLNDLEKPDDAAVLNFARVHIGLGFGAEAENILREFPINSEEARVLSSMARLVDWPGRVAAPKLAAQVDCNGDGALWGLLAHGAQTPRGVVDDQSILRSLFSMPLELRVHLAPTISEKLRALGKEDAARAARETVLRAVEEPGPELVLELAHSEPVPTDEAKPDPLAEDLRAASAKTSPDSPLVMAELMRRLGAKRTELDRKLLDDAAAQIFLHKGTPESAALFLRYVDALARTGAFQESLRYLDQMAASEHSDQYDLDQALSSLLKSLSETASDGTFLLIAGSQLDERLPATPSTDALQVVSVRLAQLGFRDEAIALLPAADNELRDGRNVVLAEAALAQDEPMEALARVANIRNADARRIRARALSRLGAHGEAAAIYTALEETEAAADSMWLASDWYALHEILEDPERREMSRRLAIIEPDPATLPPDLADTGDADGSATVIAGIGDVGQVDTAATLQERVELLEDSTALRSLISGFTSDS